MILYFFQLFKYLSNDHSNLSNEQFYSSSSSSSEKILFRVWQMLEFEFVALIPSQFKPMILKLVFTASTLDAEHYWAA